MLRTIPKLGVKWDVHLLTFLTPAALARLFWLNMVYLKALHVPGCLVEFGTQWGASLNVSMLSKLIHEPWNASRRLIAFSKFHSGFPQPTAKDGQRTEAGDYRVAQNWQAELERILSIHSACAPSRIGCSFEIIEGDVRETLPKYLAAHQ